MCWPVSLPVNHFWLVFYTIGCNDTWQALVSCPCSLIDSLSSVGIKTLWSCNSREAKSRCQHSRDTRIDLDLLRSLLSSVPGRHRSDSFFDFVLPCEDQRAVSACPGPVMLYLQVWEVQKLEGRRGSTTTSSAPSRADVLSLLCLLVFLEWSVVSSWTWGMISEEC